MRYLLPVLSVLILSVCAPKDNIPQIDLLIDQIKETAAIQDTSERREKLDQLWESLVNNNQIPYTESETALFLYRGEAESVSWNGDFNSWSGNDGVKTDGTKIEGTDIWMWKATFPSDARLDYKVTINEENWILDPSNPHQQWSGFGPNSELRMPDWEKEVLTEPVPDIPKGTLTENILIDSEIMGYSIHYRVYLPVGYEDLNDLPVLYTTDGQEYSDEKLGAVPTVLDNLIHGQRVSPAIVVFVSPLNPENGAENRRADEFKANENYLSFFVNELIPTIEDTYKASSDRDSRFILGTSFGGLNAAYFGFSRPDIFGGTAIQAPAFWYEEKIYELARNSEQQPDKIFMSVGTIGDNTEDARTMKRIFERKGLEFTYMETNEGHSWGAWGAQADDILLHFFGSL